MPLVSTDALAATGTKYRKELLAMPLVQFKEKLGPYVTIRYGIRGKEVVGTLSNDAEIMPWQKGKNETDSNNISLREIETYMGKLVEEFDPHEISNTVYGNMIATAPTETDIAKAVAMEVVKVVSYKLYKASFQGKRNATGKKTMDLFDGFCTIIDKEIASGGLAVAKGNLFQIGEITPVSAYDKIKAFYKSAVEELRDINTILYMSHDMKDAYEEDYATMFPGALYNTSFEKSTLQGSNGMCQIVALSALAGTDTMILSTSKNLLVGVDQLSDYENIEIRRADDPALAQLFMKLYWGTQFESIHPSQLLVGKFSFSQSAPIEG